MRNLVLLILWIGLIGETQGQITEVPIRFNGEIRVRGETDGRDFNNATSVNTYTLLRMRFGAEVQPLEDVKLFVQIQDSRAFGQEPSTLSNTSNLDLHQAFFQINNLWGKPIHLKVGRQEMVYGNERLIGAVGWSNVGRTFDGIKWTIGRTNRLDLFGMIINESDIPVAAAATPSTVAGRKEAGNYFYGAYYQYRHKGEYQLDVYGLYQLNLNETVPGEDDLNRATLGAYGKGKISPNFDFESELALQSGKRQGQDVLAFMLTGSIGYTFPTVKKPSLRIGVDYLSGMDEGDKDYKVFDTLFATNHAFYGFMDYFVSIPENTGGRGLVDFMVKAKIPITSKWDFNAHYHNFRAAKGSNKNFGNEFDSILNYRYNSVATFVVGLAFFLPGDIMKTVFANDDIGFWSYATFLVNF